MLFKFFFILVVSFFMISSCSLFQPFRDWPGQLPEQDYFVDYYQHNTGNQIYQDQASYLNWVRVFYLGNPVSPGWLQLTKELLYEAPLNKQQEYIEFMALLGQRIAAEWALSNQVRLIDSRSASVWRDALIEAVTIGDLENYMKRFESDVNAILVGSLSKEEIEFSRYYEEENFEFSNFL